jgi:hypothetical protein
VAFPARRLRAAALSEIACKLRAETQPDAGFAVSDRAINTL